jgi:hypothetical protein
MRQLLDLARENVALRREIDCLRARIDALERQLARIENGDFDPEAPGTAEPPAWPDRSDPRNPTPFG